MSLVKYGDKKYMFEIKGAVGPSGASGPSGSSGASGPSGPSGYPCQVIRVDNGKLYAPFKWDYVLLYGTPEQKTAFNRFRIKYIRYLFDKVCLELDDPCKDNLVGTYPSSAKSDIDYNISGKISEKIRRIAERHMELFDDSLDELFDINLYGTSFDAEIARQANFPIVDSQFVHAWLRVAKWDRGIEMSREHRELTEKALKLRVRGNYVKNLKLYLMASDTIEFSDLVTLYSEAKYFEKEAYHSLGAILHIVNGVKKMPREYFIQSAYDNFGFALEVLKVKKCSILDFDARLDKLAKYIYRICNALGGHSRLERAASAHNKNRRKHQVMTKSRDRFLRLLLDGGKVENIEQIIYDRLIKPIL